MKRIFAILLSVILLSACTTPPNNSLTGASPQSSNLDNWVNSQLLPYLGDRLGRYPRFKEQPIHLVAMDGDNLSQDVDQLTMSIRDRMHRHLLSVPGVSINRQAESVATAGYHSLADLACRENNKIVYYIGIDIHKAPTSNDYIVQVKALDLAENKWMDGFGLSWQGSLNHRQRQALQHTTPDPALLGMRSFPFTRSQPDLAAAYLTDKLGCQFLKAGLDNLNIAITGEGSDPFLQQVSGLLKQYLGQFKEIQISQTKKDATVLITVHTEMINNDLYQLWASASYLDQNTPSTGTAANAYVSLPDFEQPVISEQIVSAPDLSATPQPQAAELNTISRNLITSFQIVTPLDKKYCDGPYLWATGQRNILASETVSSGTCIALEAQPETTAWIFYLHKDEQGNISRLNDSLYNGPGIIYPGNNYRFPAVGSRSVLKLDWNPGSETLYAIAINDQNLAGEFAGTALTNQISGKNIETWLARMQQQNPANFDWQSRHIHHY